MTDVVLLQIISYIFWFGLALLAVSIFHREIKALVSSLTRFNVAGAQFELRDKKATLESYAMLSDIFVELLSTLEATERLYPMISDRNAHRLAKFTLRYAAEVPKNEQDAELLKGVGNILGRKGLFSDAIEIYDALLKKMPNDLNVLNLKCLALFNTGMPKEIERSEKIYNDLVKMYPKEGMIWFNRSLTKALLENYEGALSDLEMTIELEYWKTDAGMLKDPTLKFLQKAKPKEFEKLEAKIQKLIEQSRDT
jgi:tetratricopeptide (TPR) repeat protein